MLSERWIIGAAVLLAGCGASGDASTTAPDPTGTLDGGSASDALAHAPEAGGKDGGGVFGNAEASAPACAGVAAATKQLLQFDFLLDRSASMTSAWSSVNQAVGAIISDGSIPTNQEYNYEVQSFPGVDTASECTAFHPPGGVGGRIPNPLMDWDWAYPPPAGGVKDTAASANYWLETNGIDANRATLVVVLVTDGDALDCGESLDDVTTEVTKWAPQMPTFVATVGTPPSALNALAQAGGTQAALSIDPSNPAGFAQTLLTAAAPFNCAYVLPPPPDGGALDLMSVNVDYTPPGGTPQTLDYNPTCGGSGTGWRYNSPNDSSFIQLCHASCVATTAGGVSAHVGITVGCPTQMAQ
jgi:hypothetical protein